jgi:hypothetical protein
MEGDGNEASCTGVRTPLFLEQDYHRFDGEIAQPIYKNGCGRTTAFKDAQDSFTA